MTPFDTITILMSIVRFAFIIIWIAGLVWAVVRWSHHRSVSTLAVISLSTMVLVSVANMFIPALLAQLGPADDIARQLMWSGILLAIPQLFAWMCLLVALFGWRGDDRGQGLPTGKDQEPRFEVPTASATQRGNPYQAPQKRS